MRLVTETIMMAMTPIPPTISATLDSTIITRKNTPVSRLKTLRTWSEVSRSNVLGSPGRRPRMLRSRRIVASMASSTVTPSRGFTRMIRALVSSYRKLRRAVSNGTMAAISWPGAWKMFSGVR